MATVPATPAPDYELIDAYCAAQSNRGNQVGRAVAMCDVYASDGSMIELEVVKDSGTSQGHALKSLVLFLGKIKAVTESDTPVIVTIYTDSQFVSDGLNKWVKNWQTNGWRTKAGGQVQMRETWEQATSLVKEIGCSVIYMSASGANQENLRMALLKQKVEMEVGPVRSASTSAGSSRLPEVYTHELPPQQFRPRHSNHAPSMKSLPKLEGQGAW